MCFHDTHKDNNNVEMFFIRSDEVTVIFVAFLNQIACFY